MTEAQGRWVWRCWLQGPYSTEYRDKPSVACTALSAQQPRRKRHPGAGSMEPPCPPKSNNQHGCSLVGLFGRCMTLAAPRYPPCLAPRGQRARAATCLQCSAHAPMHCRLPPTPVKVGAAKPPARVPQATPAQNLLAYPARARIPANPQGLRDTRRHETLHNRHLSGPAQPRRLPLAKLV